MLLIVVSIMYDIVSHYSMVARQYLISYSMSHDDIIFIVYSSHNEMAPLCALGYRHN